MRLLVILAATAVLLAPARAADLAQPQGPVILTVTGNISNTNSGGEARFDLAMLENLPGRTTTTETPWTEGKVSFEGPLGQALLDLVGAEGDTLLVTALNDYEADIPTSDFANWPVILATHMNGEAMSVREKGPLFVIYPVDADPTLYNEVVFSRSVWQVKTIEVR